MRKETVANRVLVVIIFPRGVDRRLGPTIEFLFPLDAQSFSVIVVNDVSDGRSIVPFATRVFLIEIRLLNCLRLFERFYISKLRY